MRKAPITPPRREVSRFECEIFEQMDECVAVYEADGTVVYANRAMCDLVGRRPEEFIAQNLWRLFPEARGNPFYVAFQRVAETGLRENFDHHYQPWGRWYENHVFRAGQQIVVIGKDITDRKNAEEEAERARQRLSTITSALPVLVAFVDAEERYQFVNRTYQRWFGQEPEALLGKHIREVLGEAAYQELTPYVRRALSGQEVTFETQVPYQKGGVREVRGHYVPMRTGDQVEGYVSLVFDVTEQKQVDAQLRASESRLATVLEKLPIGVGLVEKSGRWALRNEAMRAFVSEVVPSLDPTMHPRWRGWDAEGNLIPPEQWPGARALQGEAIVPGMEFLYTAPDGREIWTRVSSVPIRDSSWEVVSAIGIIEDIDATKRAQLALLESEERFRTMADDSPVMIWVSDADGRVLFVNRAYVEFCGLTRSALQTNGWESFLHPEDLPAYKEAFLRATRERKRFHAQVRARRADGHWRWLESSAIPRFSSRGDFIGYVGSSPDVTELREGQAALKRALSGRDEFLSVASHELRTPLTALSLQLELIGRLIGRGATGSEKPKVLKNVEVALKQADRLETLVEGLLNVSRIASGRLELHLRPFDLREVIRETIKRLGALASRVHCELRLNLGEAVIGTWDRERLDEVVTNLVNNALKYGAGKPIEISLTADEDTATLTVRDHGIGISEEDQSRIFGRFERAVSRMDYGGLGLGLYIARQVVETHGGEILVKSAPGEGATFIVRLPKNAPPKPTRQPQEGEAPP